MFTLTNVIKEKVDEAIEQMLNNNLHETHIQKEGTKINLTIVRAGHLSDDMQKRVFQEYEVNGKKFYLVI